ncbi:MAG TPA: hypothetical protein VMG11_03600 [Steroidobacteraceae bacterium]|nr:hypothetical protein [Steroidobacteraceae bacterium]
MTTTLRSLPVGGGEGTFFGIEAAAFTDFLSGCVRFLLAVAIGFSLRVMI